MLTLLLVLAVSLATSFLCSILESVLLSVTHSHVALLRRQGSRTGALLQRMRANIDEPIAAILTLNTIAHTVGAALGGALALRVFGDEWIALFSAALTLVILLFSEILPKTVGATHWQRLASFTAHVLRILILVMKPVLIPLAWFNRLITPGRERQATVSRAELEVLAEIGQREGSIDEDELRVVRTVMKLHEIRVDEIMTPRTEVVGLSVDSSVADARRIMAEHGHLRLPAFRNGIDDIVGVVLVRDVLRARSGDERLHEFLRPPLMVPETAPAEDVLARMRGDRIKLAVVLDEFGGTAGIVTLEDVIERIVGEIQGEHEFEPLPLEIRPSGEVRLSGALSLAELNEQYRLGLPQDEYETVGGFVFGALGRVPDAEDVVQWNGSRFRVLAMEGRRVTRVALERGGKERPSA